MNETTNTQPQTKSNETLTPSSTNDKLQLAQEWIAKARSITVLSGAGISADSGIATYRDADGLWNKFRAEDFSSVEAFQKDPTMVWDWYKERRRIMAAAEPNAGHKALATLESRVMQFTVLTQNIDGLHQRAGNNNVIELHGSVWKLRCTNCLGEWETHVDLKGLPKCDSCHSLARPAVVWFGESLSPQTWEQAVRASYSDIFLVVGTSAMVNPVSELPHMAQRNRARVIEVNKEPTGLSKSADISLIGSATEILPQLATQLDGLSSMHEMDLGKAMQRGLEKFYMKYPQLRPDANMLPEKPE